VINNQEAKILVGSREAYITQTQSQAESTTVTAESVQFIDVGVKLNVVPSINKDGYITMKIKPEVSSVRETLKTTLGSQVPIVETSESETVVKVKDGNMIMIAGLMKEDKRKDVTGWPFLSRLPIIGAAFGARADLRKKTEVIIFLTPYIIKGNEPIGSAELQQMVPSDVLPEELGDKMINERIKQIDTTIGKEVKFQELSEEDDASAPFAVPVKTESGDNSASIQYKMKGIKEY
jgi:type II secretory pathway component GspD/PulD (secretin)